MNNDLNRVRAFADVVSVDAWHQSFDEGKQEVDLKVDVVFTEGRIGGERGSPVQFRLKLKRATLIVITPETEPVEVVRESIRREENHLLTEFSSEQVTKSDLAAGFDVNASANLAGGIKGALSVHTAGKHEISRTDKEKVVGKHHPMKALFRINNVNNTYSWIIDCDAAQFLEGRIWDANASPLMKLRDLRNDPQRGIAPNVRVAVQCLREDLIITDIKLKDDPSLKDKILGNDEKLKLKAAEAYIRTKLTEIGLEVGDLSNDFAKLVLMDLVAKTER
ncbi:hypothetical protein [Rhizobium leguminosarum]|uniref:hypothetical protein n=1 Tax=Rhizobium leguminosarum TaxID=384 RepID=UPI001249E115|nr:hypothetical protein [Rhizobium leguminosarum]